MNPLGSAKPLERLPIRMTAEKDLTTGVERARWSRGKPVASARLRLGPRPEPAPDAKAPAEAARALEVFSGALRHLRPTAGAGKTRSEKDAEIPLEVVENHCVLIGTSLDEENTSSPSIQVSVELGQQMGKEHGSAVENLVLLGITYCLARINRSGKRESLHALLDRYLSLSRVDRAEIVDLLAENWVDPHGSLRTFLRSATDPAAIREIEGPEHHPLDDISTATLESWIRALGRDKGSAGVLARIQKATARLGEHDEALAARVDRLLRALKDGPSPENLGELRQILLRVIRWRDRWVAWLMGQSRIDLPYDGEQVIELLETHFDDVDEKRALVNQVVSRTYSAELEGGNIERIGAWALENGVRLVGGRLSRAFGNQAHLLSAAKLIDEREELKRLADRLEKAAAEFPELSSQVTRISLLAGSSESLPAGQLIGAIDLAEEALIDHVRRTARDRVAAKSAHIQSGLLAGLSPSVAPPAHLEHQVGKIRSLLDELRLAVRRAKQRDAAYVVFLQRLHPAETIGLANANACRDVHPGKEEDLRDLTRLGGHNFYSSPGAGRVTVGKDTREVHWISCVGDWIEAIPLFIKETVVRRPIGEGEEIETIETAVDQEAMEAFFRAHAEYWARNIENVMTSEHVWLARKILAEIRSGGSEKNDDETIRWMGRENPAVAGAVAGLAAIITLDFEDRVADVNRLMELEEMSRPEALERVLRQESSTRLAKILTGNEKDWDKLAKKCEAIARKKGDLRKLRSLVEALLSRASQKVRPLPALHILTTESAGMTEGYVQSWLEEEMALANVIRGEGLEGAVSDRVREYRKTIQTIGKKVITDLGMDVVVEEVMAEQRVDEPAAIASVLQSYRPVAQEVARLAVLIEAAWSGRKGSRNGVKDPPAVERYLKDHRSALERAALPQVVANNGRAIEEKIEDYIRQHPRTRRETAERQVVEEEPDFRSEWQSLMRSLARQEVLARLDRERPELGLAARAQNYLRERTQLARSTARKAILAEQGLQHLTLQPRYVYQATGGNKRYHLLYTPSRVNLGERERDSVAKWRQWVGGADDAAARHGLRFYSLINEGGVEERPALPHAEIQKTSENALCVTHFAGSNGLALLIGSIREGDVEDMADQMNLREDRMVPPAGEGYGGYCVPKDGLFLAFVLSLSNDVKLRQMGIPDHLHQGVMNLAREAIQKRNEFDTNLDWQVWAADHLVREETLRRFFQVRDGVPVFQVTKVARAIQNLGEPWSEVSDGPTLLANLSARWGVQHMIIDAEQVNRFMTFYKAWMIYDALKEARRHHPQVAPDDEARFALSAEYKPVQDVRFSTGMRLFEMLARTGNHLTHSLDEEGQNLIHLMLEGFDPEGDHPIGQRVTRALCREYGISPKDKAAVARFREMFPRHAPPADITMTSVTMSSTQDMLFYTSDARLDQIADAVQVQLNDRGLTQEQIQANAEVYGGNLRRWAGLRDLPKTELDDVVAGIGGDVHALVLKLRGPGRDYQKDVQGVDVLNTGIPFPELLDLLHDPPRLVFLMQTGNPNSALAITDGAAGRAHRCMTERDIMAFFAACEKTGRRGVYRAVGLGSHNIERLCREMHEKRQRGQDLLDALEAVAGAAEGDEASRAVQNALDAYAGITARIREKQEPLRALREEERLRRYKRWQPRDGFISRAMAAIGEGIPLGSVDVGTWLAGVGGWLVVMGEDASRIAGIYRTIRKAVRRVAELQTRRETDPGSALLRSPFTKKEEEEVIAALARPRYVPEIQGFVQEMLVETSSKAVEVAAIEALERRKALRARAARARALSERENGFRTAWDEIKGKDFRACAERARGDLEDLWTNVQKIESGAGERETETHRQAANAAFGRFLAATRGTLVALAAEIFQSDSAPHRESESRFLNNCSRIYTGREIVLEDWKKLAGGYEDVGGIARLAEAARHDRKKLSRIAEGIELFYITFCLGQTLEFALTRFGDADSSLLWKRLTDFFAETINDHFHPYTPWAYARGAGFVRYSQDELYRLAVERHQWLYRYLRWLIITKTEIREIPADDQDHLLGNFLDGSQIVPVGADGAGDVERQWRAYNQLREMAFIRSDGFPVPPVFSEFDPDIIEGSKRMNLLFLYPVGRTHVSRAFREGPTLNGELRREGRPGVNLLISRHEEFGPVEGGTGEAIWIRSAHLYLSEDEYRKALMSHRGMTATQVKKRMAEERENGRLTGKGIRVAARFVKKGRPAPILAGSVVPFHGHPLYESGALEDHGLPATSQSLIFTDVTYDKSLYPQIYGPGSGVELPAEIDWLADSTKSRSESAARREIESGSKKNNFRGLRRFAERHPIVLIKGAAESGARNLKVFDLQTDGRIDEEALRDAVNFVYDVSKRQNVVIQEALLTSPEFWGSEGLMESFVSRQILEWNRSVKRNYYPRSHIYGSLRIIAASSHPDQPYDTAFPIALSSLQVATNVGRGGTLEILLPEYIQEEHREAILGGLREQAPRVMEACARFARRYEKTFHKTRGRKAGKDRRGVPYTWPPYLMLDFLASPVFEKPGRLVDIEPRYDKDGNRIGSRVTLEDSRGRFEGKIRSWRFIHLEPNIGIGLWDRYNLREEVHERRRSQEEGRLFNWDNVGQSDRIVLRTFVKAGEEYLAALRGG